MDSFPVDLYNWLGSWIAAASQRKMGMGLTKTTESVEEKKGVVERKIVVEEKKADWSQVSFYRVPGTEHEVRDLEKWIETHLKVTTTTDPGFPMFVVVQSSGPRLYDSVSVTKTVEDLKTKHPWVCLIVLRYASTEIQPEDYSSICPSFIRFLYSSTSLIFRCSQNESSWNELSSKFEQAKNLAASSVSASVLSSSKSHLALSSSSSQVQKDAPRPSPRAQLCVLRVAGAETACPQLEAALSKLLGVPTCTSPVEGYPIIVVIQTSGPRISQEDLVTGTIKSLNNHPWICLLSLRYSTKEVTDPEDQTRFGAHHICRLIYSDTRGLLEVSSNSSALAGLRKAYSDKFRG